jgi:dienelactone hydrolase
MLPFGLPVLFGQPWPLEKLQRAPRIDWVDSEGPLRSLYYEGEPYRGRASRVFAYYAVPPNATGPMPAVVLVHGGGGAAFPEWAWMWAQRGYVAIAMDLAGKGAQREPLPDGGPDQTDTQKFSDIADGLQEAWTYHAVANVVRAVSFLASRPEVDAERIGITGISWGGYLTSIVAGVDQRLKAAVPVYGCGFIYRNSPWVKNLDGLPSDLRRLWIENFDPSSHLPRARVPMLWVNRTNDFHYRMDNYQSSYQLPSGPRKLSIIIDRNHSHPAGWAPSEIAIFMDEQLRGGAPLPKMELAVRSERKVSAGFQAAVEPSSAALVYTAGDPTDHETEWLSLPARISNGQIMAELPEPEPRAWFLTLTDVRGATVSTECAGCR